MYGCFVTEPEDDGADLGVVFFHNAGYSTACGHGTIALVTWAIESGLVDRGPRSSSTCPSGRLPTVARVEDGRVASVRFRNVPAFVHARGLEAAGRTVDVAFGGAFYASLEERVEPAELPRLIELGRAIKADLERGPRDRPPARARAARRLRRDLLAGGGRGSAHAAERHRLRRRRGRPLAVRQRHLGPARAPPRRGPARDRRAAPPPEHRRQRVHRPRRRGDRRAACHRGRGQRPPDRAGTSSCSTRTTSSARASCCASVRAVDECARTEPHATTTLPSAIPSRASAVRRDGEHHINDQGGRSDQQGTDRSRTPSPASA